MIIALLMAVTFICAVFCIVIPAAYVFTCKALGDKTSVKNIIGRL